MTNLTIGELEKFIGAFEDKNIPVVMGKGGTEVYPCWVNTYYSPDKQMTVQIVIDPQTIECEHEWVSADNEKVKGYSICTKCNEMRATSDI